jgi:hypothetical protein
MATQDELNVALIAPLAAAYRSFREVEQAELYSSSFTTTNAEVLALAVRRCIDTEAFLPSVARIRAEVRMIQQERQGLVRPRELPMSPEEVEAAEREKAKVMARLNDLFKFRDKRDG